MNIRGYSYSLYFSLDLRERVEKAAAKAGVSPSRWVTEACETKLKNTHKKGAKNATDSKTA